MRNLVLVLGGLFVSGAQDPTRDAAMLREAQQLAQPVDAHARLERLAGEWQVEVTAAPSGGAEQTTRGSVVGKAILGGRYVVLNYRLPFGGRDVEAVQILGFDTLHRVYTSSWRDDGSTWSVECAGPEDAAAKDVLSLRGELSDAQDPTGRPFRLEFDLRAADAVSVRLFDRVAGKEVRVQTQRWTRR